MLNKHHTTLPSIVNSFHKTSKAYIFFAFVLSTSIFFLLPSFLPSLSYTYPSIFTLISFSLSSLSNFSYLVIYHQAKLLSRLCYIPSPCPTKVDITYYTIGVDKIKVPRFNQLTLPHYHHHHHHHIPNRQ